MQCVYQLQIVNLDELIKHDTTLARKLATQLTTTVRLKSKHKRYSPKHNIEAILHSGYFWDLWYIYLFVISFTTRDNIALIYQGLTTVF